MLLLKSYSRKQLAEITQKDTICIGFDEYKATKICLNCGKIGHIKNKLMGWIKKSSWDEENTYEYTSF